MRSRKEMKKAARKVVKTHYLLLMVLCIFAIFYCGDSGFTKAMSDAGYSAIMGEDFAPEIGFKSFKLNSNSVHKDVLNDIAEGNIKEGEQTASNQMDAYQQGKAEDPVMGHTRGQLAPAVNFFTSGKFYLELNSMISSLFHSKNAGSALLVLLVSLGGIAVWVFLKNMYQAIIRRAFLEARTYEVVPIGHLLHFLWVRRWIRAALTLLLESIYFLLWSITIVGAVIKYYSYRMVPFIVAENPDMKPKEVITLSRKMMNGHKWECFVLDLSFIGWHIIGALTLGLSEYFWTVPYYYATYSEYYTELRKLAKENNIPGAEKLNDTYLFEHDEETHLREVYSDVESQKAFIDENRVVLPKARAFVAKNFGLWIGTTEEKIAYDEVDSVRQQIREDRAVIKGKIYPQRLNPLWRDKQNRSVREIHFLRTYTIWSVILMFFFFSLVGWIWEVSLHLISDGEFVNRGTMHGPWLPIYGCGMIFILILLARWRSKPVVETILITILCGMVEFGTSWYLEATKGLRWWDYTGYFLNLNGRICAEGLFVFAVGGCFAIYLLIPLLDAIFSHIKKAWLIPICVILVVAFVGDAIYSSRVPNVGDGITNYTDYLAPDGQDGQTDAAEG